MLTAVVPRASYTPRRRGTRCSGPRAVVMPPRSMGRQPRSVSSPATVCLAGGSSPERNTVLGQLSALGLVIRVAGRLLRVLTTLASREGRLDLLREARVGVGELPVGGDRERDVDEDLAGEILVDIALAVKIGRA